MKNKLSVLAASILLIVFISPAHADSVVQLWSCELKEGKTQSELMEVSVAWMNAVMSMDGAKEFEGHLEFPITSDNLGVFTFVLVADNAKNWGAFENDSICL